MNVAVARRRIRLFLLRNRTFVGLGAACVVTAGTGTVLVLLGNQQVGASVMLASALPLVLAAVIPGRRRHQLLRECALVFNQLVVDEARKGLHDLETWLREKRR